MSQGDVVAELLPAETLSIDFAIDFPDAAIGKQARTLSMVNGAFVHELADCRTFCRRADVEAMQANGLALGGSLDNAVVVEGDRVLNPGGFRRADECVRHKMLDALGDLALAGAPILGAYRGVRAGHGATNRLLRKLVRHAGRLGDGHARRRGGAAAARRGRRLVGPAPRRLRADRPTAISPAQPPAGCAFRFNPPETCANSFRPQRPRRPGPGRKSKREAGSSALASRFLALAAVLGLAIGVSACSRMSGSMGSMPGSLGFGNREAPLETQSPQQIYLGGRGPPEQQRAARGGRAVLRGRAALSLFRMGQAGDADVGLRLPRGRASTPRAAPPPSATSSSSPPTSTPPMPSS